MTPDELRIAGFLDPRRALSFFEELPGGAEAWERDLGASADPDQALLAAIRLHEADPGLVRGLVDKPDARRRVCAVLGGSQWLGDYVIADPTRAVAIWEDPGRSEQVLLASVGATRAAGGAYVAAEGASADDLRQGYDILRETSDLTGIPIVHTTGRKKFLDEFLADGRDPKYIGTPLALETYMHRSWDAFSHGKI